MIESYRLALPKHKSASRPVGPTNGSGFGEKDDKPWTRSLKPEWRGSGLLTRGPVDRNHSRPPVTCWSRVRHTIVVDRGEASWLVIALRCYASGEAARLSIERDGFESRTARQFRSVAQPGSALRSERRGRWFKSTHSDQFYAARNIAHGVSTGVRLGLINRGSGLL